MHTPKNVFLQLYCRPTRTCNGFSDCMASGDGWKWIGGGSTAPMDLEASHQASVSSFEVSIPTNCIYLENNQLKDRVCGPTGDTLIDYATAQICTIGYGGVGLGSSIGNLTTICKNVRDCMCLFACMLSSPKPLKV